MRKIGFKVYENARKASFLACPMDEKVYALPDGSYAGLDNAFSADGARLLGSHSTWCWLEGSGATEAAYPWTATR